MKTRIWSVFCIVALLVLGASGEAFAQRRPKKKPAWTPPPAPTPTPAPSVDLSKFIGANLDKILGPLDAKTPLPRAELAQLRASISSRFSKASLAERGQYQAALAVCDTLAQAMDERNKATVSRVADWPQRAQQLRQNIEQLVARQRAAEASAPTPTPAR